jgi:hypothetical protein
MHPSIFLNSSKWIKNEEDMGLKLERGLELFFQNNWSKLLTIIFMWRYGAKTRERSTVIFQKIGANY